MHALGSTRQRSSLIVSMDGKKESKAERQGGEKRMRESAPSYEPRSSRTGAANQSRSRRSTADTERQCLPALLALVVLLLLLRLHLFGSGQSVRTRSFHGNGAGTIRGEERRGCSGVSI